MLDKRAQISDTMTWVVATLVIVIVLVVSIYAASLGGFFKGSRGINEKQQVDLLVTKSLMAYLQSDDGAVLINAVKSNDFSSINSTKKDNAKKIFYDLYDKDYPYDKWFGIVEKGISLTGQYASVEMLFGKKKSIVSVCDADDICVEERINLENNKELEFGGVKRR